MNYQAMVGVLREAGVEVRDQSVLPSALGLPDGARTRLLVDHDGLFRVYCAENLPSTLPMSRVKGALKAAGDEALLLMDRGGGRFVALHTTAEGDATHAELGEAEVVQLLPNVRAVGGEDPYAVSERVRELILHPEEEREAYQNKGLFSDDYLKHRLIEPGQYPEWREDVSQAREKLRGLYGSKKGYLDGLNEAQTENEFLDEALGILGHTFVKQTRTKDGSRPDYALFGDVGAKDEALRVQGDPTKLYASSLAVAESKYWGRNLDVYTKRDDKDNEATAGQKSSPEMQIARYLQETGLSWGILTNGSEWRLYHGGAPGMTKRYYSVDLARALESEDPEDFRRFYLFFRRDAFVPKGAEGKSFLDRVHTGSEEYAVRVGNNLKKVVFEKLFAQLATGFLEYHGREIGQPVDEEVLDPAMGSGHFLVAAVDYLTDEFSRIISELDAETVVEELAELRAEVRASLEAYGASATDEQLSDANLLKRMVLKRCVYGVDLNEMAVELAKLSLWLDAFTVGAPLSFLDHHLKHGNSLIGSSVREVRRELESSGSLSGTAFEGLLSGAETMHELEEIPDATITQVRDSASLYAVADKILDPMKRVMDVWTSKHFDNAFAETVLRDELSAKNFPELKRGNLSSFSDRGRNVFETAADLRRTKEFFHWELEFPEVFYEGARERENAGFDAVVGNPPYVSAPAMVRETPDLRSYLTNTVDLLTMEVGSLLCVSSSRVGPACAKRTFGRNRSKSVSVPRLRSAAQTDVRT